MPFVSCNTPLVGNLRFCRGVTLIELMVTVVVGSILMLVAIPSFQTFINNSRLTSATNDLIGSLTVARSEALKRNTRTVVCKSGGGTTCTTAGTWQSGWLVYADLDNDGTLDATDPIVRRHEGTGDSASTSITAPADTIVFTSAGKTAAGIFRICNSVVKKRKNITLNTAGRHTLMSDGC